MTNLSPADAQTLRYLVVRMQRRLRNETQDASPLNQAEETVLEQLLVAPRQTGAELARFQRITPQSMNVMVKSLLERGYLVAKKNLADKRRKELELTEVGERMISSILYRREAWILERAQEVLDEEEANQLAAALPLLRRLVDREPRPEQDESTIE